MSEKEPNEPYKPSESETKSLDLLHEGQGAALSGDLDTACDKLRQSLAVAKNGDDHERIAYWTAYLEGTLAYFNGDLAGLKSLIASAGDNAPVLSRLAQGLENRGTSNYKEDYGT